MPVKSLIMASLTCFAVMLPTPLLRAQSVNALLARLSSPETAARIAAFDTLIQMTAARHIPLCSQQANNETKTGLVSALAKENAVVYHGHHTLSEAEADEFFPTLIGCVAELRDPRAASLLAEAIDTGGGAMNGLLALGDTGIAVAVQTLRRAPRGTARFAAASALGAAATRNPAAGLSSTTMVKVRSALLASAVNDSTMMVRGAAIRALKPFSDAEVRATIQRLEAQDSGYSIPGENTRRFPVRDAAREWMKTDSVRVARIRP